MKRLIISIVLAMVLLVLPASGVFAATSANVTVTAQPGYIEIINSPDNWTINDVALDTGKSIAVNTWYYANTAGDTQSPAVVSDAEAANIILDGECHFGVTNNSGINIIITVNFPDPVTGDSTNGDSGSNGATTFGALSYTSYTGFDNYSTHTVIAQKSGSDPLLTTGTAGDNFKWGLAYQSQQNAWSSGTAMVSTVVISAAPA